MARTETEIENEILTYKASRTELNILSSLSNTAIWRAWVNVCKRILHTIETLFDDHKSKVDIAIKDLKPHSANWYANKVLSFQYGRALVVDTDYYDNTGLNDTDIESEQVVKYATAREFGSVVLIKVAGESNGEKEPLPSAQEAALESYISEIKDAGVVFTLVNRDPDYYRATIQIYYDPMILDSDGNRLDGSVPEPVQTEIKEYISNLPFNGEYTNMALVDKLQAVEGVVIPELILAETKFGQNDWAPVTAKVTPDSGYMRVYDDNDLTLEFIPYGNTN
jgi:hypothetical protein